MYYKLDINKLSEKHIILGSRCSGKTMHMKQNARDYYAKNENSMTEERKQEFKKLFRELWGEEL